MPDADATLNLRTTPPEAPAGAGGGSPHWEREAVRHKANFVGALERARRAEALSEQHWRLALSYQEYFKRVEAERDAAIAYREDAEEYANSLLKLLNRADAELVALRAQRLSSETTTNADEVPE